MAETATAAPLLRGCGLPQAWAGLAAWRILETRFCHGLAFLQAWRTWKDDPQRPRMLHFVSLTAQAPDLDALMACAASFPPLQPLADELAAQWFGLLPGFHRFSLENDQVLLTLCIGETTSLLRAQQFLADSVYLDTQSDNKNGPPWNAWTCKALARCCRRGTRLSATALTPDLRSDLMQSGFQIPIDSTHAESGFLWGEFNPRWTIKNTREAPTGEAQAPGTCAVIGAGLAGASVASALARRGWQVTVLDQADAPACGASGLPVGLAVPHVSIDDCTLSRLSRSGIRLLLQQARSLLRRGQDWDASGTLERRLDGNTGLPHHWPEAGLDWAHQTTLNRSLQSTTDLPEPNPGTETETTETPAIWHTPAAWLKPSELVRAWLTQTGITFRGNSKVAGIRRSGHEWALLDTQGVALVCAERVVFANAHGALPLLESLPTLLPALGINTAQLPAMHGVRGQVSWALHADAPDPTGPFFPPFPVNGSGSMVANVPCDEGRAWFVGAGYQADNQPPLADEINHAANLARLNKLLPELGQALAPQFAQGLINTWKNTRCVTVDRLPLVGPLYEADNPSLWLCIGMGSRGLSFSVLCAELLAACWGAEPLAIEASMARALYALRAKA